MFLYRNTNERYRLVEIVGPTMALRSMDESDGTTVCTVLWAKKEMTNLTVLSGRRYIGL